MGGPLNYLIHWLKLAGWVERANADPTITGFSATRPDDEIFTQRVAELTRSPPLLGDYQTLASLMQRDWSRRRHGWQANSNSVSSPVRKEISSNRRP